MINRSLQIAIDHGSTNSAIAVMTPQGPEPIWHGSKGEFLFPSCVFVYENRRTIVGKPARDALAADWTKGNGKDFYKPMLGTSELFPFVRASITKTPEDMATDVIGGLLHSYRGFSGREPYAAVITVPAMFSQSQYDATRNAAMATGLRYVATIQEPVAAATGYGFDAARMDDETWMVFDLGGGTLDVSLVMVRQGAIVSPEGCQLGDNFCGGGHFDRDLAEFIVRERLMKQRKLKLEKFFGDRRSAVWHLFLLACERAKIELSDNNEVELVFEHELCCDDSGKPFSVREPLDRETYERLISPRVEKACTVCEDLLKKRNLKRDDVSRVILVGGPTQTPFVRARLAKRLGIELDTKVDPMTAVVRGAAVYAATQQIPVDIYRELVDELSGGNPEDVKIRVEAPPTSQDDLVPIGGIVEGLSTPEDYKVEVSRMDGGWSSSPLPLDEDGGFEVDALLRTGQGKTCSTFEIKIFEPAGRVVATQSGIEIWHNVASIVMSLPNPIMVELRDNRTSRLIRGGAALPCEETDTFFTTRPIKATPLQEIFAKLRSRVKRLEEHASEGGSSSTGTHPQRFVAQLTDLESESRSIERRGEVREKLQHLAAVIEQAEESLAAHGVDVPKSEKDEGLLRIRVLEGAPNSMGVVQDAANCNTLIFELVIPSYRLERDIPEETEIEVTVRVDESQI